MTPDLTLVPGVKVGGLGFCSCLLNGSCILGGETVAHLWTQSCILDSARLHAYGSSKSMGFHEWESRRLKRTFMYLASFMEAECRAGKVDDPILSAVLRCHRECLERIMSWDVSKG